MKKLFLLKTWLLLCALIVGSGTMWGQSDYPTIYTSNVTLSPQGGTNASSCEVDGYPGIKCGTSSKTGAMKLTVPAGAKYLHFHAAGWNGENVTIGITPTSSISPTSFNLTSDTGVKKSSPFTLAGSGSTYYHTITFSSALAVNTELTITSTSGHRFVVWGVNSEEEAASVTSLSIKTPPTKTEYKVGETLDLTGLVLNADETDVTSGYTASPANGSTLSETGTKTVTITYGGKEVEQTIYVGSLTGIAITTAPTTTVYNEGQTFDPTGMVVKATYDTGDGHTWQEEINDYTYPTTALEAGTTSVTISYGGQNTTQNITVNAASAYTVTFDAGTGTCGTASLTEASALAGVTLPTATIGISGWSFAGWATAPSSNTAVAPTLYAAGNTYHPTDDETLYAVYSFSDAEHYQRATTVDQITSASSIIVIDNRNGKLLNYSLSGPDGPTESENLIEIPENCIFTLSGNNTDGFTLSGNESTLGAASLPSSGDEAVLMTSSNNLWIIEASSYADNTFILRCKETDNTCLEYYSGWVVYKTGTNYLSNQYIPLKIYCPITVYNSNPATIANPTVTFSVDGDKTLYVYNENEYTNAAGATNNAGKSVTYTSSDETVATVTDAGVVTALKAGTTTITAAIAAEVGVNTAASDTYTLTVKDASNVAGLKAITSTSSEVSFVADLTDAVVTYVCGEFAYIQDASGAVFVDYTNNQYSLSGDLTAGYKINGEVTGTIKASYKIDQITDITLDNATVTEDGVAPAALTKTVAEVLASGTTLDGQLVTVSAATVSGNITIDDKSGASIKDASGNESLNLYAPNKGVVITAEEIGSFTGFISYYNENSYRLNVYEQSQYVKTQNAPTEQTLTFTSDAVELDEETDAYTAFTGQAVSGAQGTVSYAITADESSIITSFNTETGVVVLSGACGTATITATAAAANIEVEGVTTPYTETAKSYTITVRPRYTVTFNVNGAETDVRQASYGAAIDVHSADATLLGYTFMGWSEAVVDATDVEPSMVELEATYTPTEDKTFYAVYALQSLSGSGGSYTLNVSEEDELYNQALAYDTEKNHTAKDGSVWTIHAFSQKNSTYGLQINKGRGASIGVPTCPSPITTIEITCKSGAIKAVGFSTTASDGTEIVTGSEAISQELDLTSKALTGGYIIPVGGNSIITKIVVNYGPTVSNSNYRTSIPSTASVTIGASTYASYCNAQPINFSGTSVKAYKAMVNEGNVVLTEVTDGIVPANTGVVLKGAADTYEVPVATSAGSFDFTGNEMVGVTERTLVEWTSEEGYNYILQQGVFNKANDGYLKANRAYLHTSYDVTAAGARSLQIVFDDETTGIQNIESNKTDNRYYNIKGQRVENPKKGLYILNGKKVFVK